MRQQIDADIAADRLTSPIGNNAHEKLVQLENIDPQDQFIDTRREQIRERYMGWIERSLQTGRKDRAETYLTSMALIPGSDQALAQARKDMANAPEVDPATIQSADGNPAAGQYPAICKKPGFFKRTPAYIRMTNKTTRRQGMDWPTGTLRRINLNDDKLWVYVELPSLAIRDYDVHMFVYDSAGRLRVKGNSKFHSSSITETKWTTWDSFEPTSNAPTGMWYMMMCEGGYRHVVKRINAIRR